jgi:hypothetical protein
VARGFESDVPTLRALVRVAAPGTARGWHSDLMGMKGKQWEDLSPEQRRLIVVLGAVTSILQAIMLWDLWRRPDEQIRGSKGAWVAASFVRPLGQIAYLFWGRPEGGDGD